jgi:hypothetical protein
VLTAEQIAQILRAVFGGRWPTGPPTTQPSTDPQLQNRVSLITAMPFSKTDRP